MTEAVKQAIEELYLVCGEIPRPTVLDMSPFKDAEDFQAVLDVPLRELSDSDAWAYHYSAISTVGMEEDFCYYLPRLLELCASDPNGLDREVLFQKIPLAGWPGKWPERRREAFQTYMDAVCASWQEAEVPEMDSWVCALSFCHADLGACLDHLLADTEAARSNLRSLDEDNREALQKGRLRNPFWKTRSPGYAQVLAWFGREDVRDCIQALDRL